MIGDGETGVLHAPGDVGAFSAALRRLIVAPELRTRLGHAARAEVATHGWPGVAAAYDELYRKVGGAEEAPPSVPHDVATTLQGA